MKANGKPPVLLSVEDVAKTLQCSTTNVYSLIESGELVFVRIGKLKGYRIKPQDLEAFIDARRIQHAAATRKAPLPQLKHIKL